jgi:hypothetical protein
MREIGYAALFLWFPLSALAFALLRPQLASAVLLVGGALLLPVGLALDAQGMPPLGKHEIASLSVLLAFALLHPRRLGRARPGLGLEWLVLVLIGAGVGTVLTNGDPLAYGPTRLPGLTGYEALSMGIRDLLFYGVPFFIGRALFGSCRDVRDLFRVLIVSALAYSVLMLFEVRMSPSLHHWVYGWRIRSFHFRYGGWRPSVFMANGLALALFVATSVVIGTALSRARVALYGIPARLATAYLFGVLVMCRSLAAIAYTLVVAPVVILLRPRLQVLVAVVISVSAGLYPWMRVSGLFPTEVLVSLAEQVDADRAHSLDFRFENEDILFEKAQERPVFGWGGFRRSRVFHPVRGNDMSVTDGFSVIILGTRGIFGLLTTFGLLVWPVLIAYRRLPRVSSLSDRALISSLSLVVAINTIDLLPNGLFSYLPYLFAGALIGVVQGSATGPQQGDRADAPPVGPGQHS